MNENLNFAKRRIYFYDYEGVCVSNLIPLFLGAWKALGFPLPLSIIRDGMGMVVQEFYGYNSRHFKIEQYARSGLQLCHKSKKSYANIWQEQYRNTT